MKSKNGVRKMTMIKRSEMTFVDLSNSLSFALLSNHFKYLS